MPTLRNSASAYPIQHEHSTWDYTGIQTVWVNLFLTFFSKVQTSSVNVGWRPALGPTCLDKNPMDFGNLARSAKEGLLHCVYAVGACAPRKADVAIVGSWKMTLGWFPHIPCNQEQRLKELVHHVMKTGQSFCWKA